MYVLTRVGASSESEVELSRAEDRRALRAAGYKGKNANNLRSKEEAIDVVNRLRYSTYLAMQAAAQSTPGAPTGVAEDSEA